jgi:hypothetical protein
MFDESGAEVERLTLSIKADMEAQSGRLDGLQVSATSLAAACLSCDALTYGWSRSAPHTHTFLSRRPPLCLTLSTVQDYIARKRAEAVAGGAKPGRPLPSAEDALGAGKPAAPSGGRVVGAGTPHPPDLLNSVQGISHGDVIVGQLKGQLLGFTRSLKGILQERSEAMKAQADRRQQFGAVRDLGRPLSLAPVSTAAGGGGLPPMGGAALAAASGPAGGWRGGSAAGGPGGVAASQQPQPLWQQQHALPQHQQPQQSDHAVVSFGGGGGGSASPSTPSAADAFQQMSQAQLVPEAAFLNARAQDVQQIERHIHDLSSLFSRLAHVVAEQGALVERIEDETESALQNMEAGQAQLGRYWERVSSNRGLALRVASMLVGAAILFSVFGV